jgi:hypothetical protein
MNTAQSLFLKRTRRQNFYKPTADCTKDSRCLVIKCMIYNLYRIIENKKEME